MLGYRQSRVLFRIRGSLTATVSWLILVVAAPTLNASEVSDEDEHFERGIKVLANEISRYPQLPLQLDFADFIAAQANLKLPDLSRLKLWQQRLEQLPTTTVCQQIQKASLAFHGSLLTERHKLTKLLPKTPSYDGNFDQFAGGADLYRHWLRSWLWSDVSLETLQQIAYLELAAVAQLRTELTTPEQITHAELSNFKASERRAIVSALRHREQTVKQHLEAMFNTAGSTPRLTIAPSNLPQSFPAPGIYDNTTQTFYYHLQGDNLPEKHLDWLYLHEGVPGHHWQFNLSRQQPLCPSIDGLPQPLVSAEGWAAYVETLGTSLGLYTHPSSQQYALDWRALRALRVLTDTGLHALDWPQTKIEALWQQYLPDQPDIMAREIDRVKRWPAQSITYVYGKHLIEQAMRDPRWQQMARANIHEIIVKLSNYPPQAFQHIAAFIKEDQ